MPAPVAVRHRAAVEALELAGDETILEIGCGQGVATTLMLQRLTAGTLTALDRSPKMIDALRRSAPEAIASGRLIALAEAVEDAALPASGFDRIVAVNVDLTLRLGTRWLGLLQALLRPDGLLVLAFEAPPGSGKADGFAAATTALLETAGYRTVLTQVGAVAVVTARL